jgi:signal transduction histidine kinase
MNTFTSAAELLRRFARGVNIGSAAQLEQQATIVMAAAVLAVAAELRDLHNAALDTSDAQLRAELDSALADVRALSDELRLAETERDALRAEIGRQP